MQTEQWRKKATTKYSNSTNTDTAMEEAERKKLRIQTEQKAIGYQFPKYSNFKIRVISKLESKPPF